MGLTIEYFNIFTWFWIGIAIAIFFVLLLITAPYGRHSQTSWGPMINNHWGWIFMESILLIVFFYFIYTGEIRQSLTSIIIIGLVSIHYINRSIVFPFRLRTKGKKMPIVIMLMGIFFNVVNGFLLGYYLGNLQFYEFSWITSPQFIIGFIIFWIGLIINWQSDTILIQLRKPTESGYRIPKGKLFRLVSCPNLLGEIIEWGGFAILTWSLPGFAFFAWTFANLVPRALSHHKWYKQKFKYYPNTRKAVFPHIL